MPYVDPEAARARTRRRYEQDGERMRAQMRQRYAENAEFRERVKSRVAARRRADPEGNKKRKRDYYRRNRARIRAAARERRRADPTAAARADRQSMAAAQRRLARDPEGVRARQRENSARRRARLRGNYVERVDPEVVWARDEGICGICGEPAELVNWHMDHVVAIARGGEHSYANVQVSHPLCNRRKAAS